MKDKADLNLRWGLSPRPVPAANVAAAGGKTVYLKLPCYDSPCFLADASALDYAESEEAVVTRLAKEQGKNSKTTLQEE